MALLNRLVKKGLISHVLAEEIEKEAQRVGVNVEELLLDKNLISELDLFEQKAKELNINFIKEAPERIESDVLESIPQESVEHYQMVPIIKKDNNLEVAMVYPGDLKAQEALNFLARQKGFTYRVSLISPSVFKIILKQYQTLGKEVKSALRELEIQLRPEQGDGSPALIEKGGEAPISKTVAVILRHAVDGGASDIHIEPLKTQTRVRFRLDGILHPSLLLPQEIHNSIVARIKIISKLKIDETRIPQDGRFSVGMAGQVIDFRVSTFPTTLGEKVVMRVLNPNQKLVDFQELGLTGRNLEIIKSAIKKPYGMILSTGPTGSGKTTTLYVTLDSINKEGVNIVTLEDPVEYFIKGVSQSQIKPEIGYTFADGLRHVLRQDPDVIMVGEIRDAEAAELATHASLTGHVVLSTIHTNNALGVVPRLIDLGVRSFLIPSSINIMIAQRLVRKLCKECKKKISPPDKVRKLILDELRTMPGVPEIDTRFSLYEPVGCPKCGGTGYSGRIGIFEILEMTPELGDIILSELTEKNILAEAKRQGMVAMRQDGMLKVINGVTSIEEVLRTT